MGAGRKPAGAQSGVSHLRRPSLNRHLPVHITLRVRPQVWNLRTRRCFRFIERAFGVGCDRFGFRLVHFSVQRNHFHLVCEGNDRRALSRGLQGIAIRLAKGLNAVMGRKGRVFADRYHEHVLRTPSEVKHAVHYVLHNASHHRQPLERAVDPFCSLAATQACVTARSWLLCNATAGARPKPRAPTATFPKTDGRFQVQFGIRR